METKDLKAKAEEYKRLIEETKRLSTTSVNSGYWMYRLKEMEQVLTMIDLNLSLRSACNAILHK